MDVRCERCRAEYAVDDARVPEAGVKVACPGCGHGFLLRKRVLAIAVPLRAGDGDATIPVSELAPSGEGPSTAPRGQWRLRQASGAVFPFRELSTLQRWIVERKASREDEVASGEGAEDWRRLGDIPELRSFFALLERAGREPAAAPGEPGAGPDVLGASPGMEDPAWAREAGPLPSRPTGPQAAIPRPRRRVIWIALLAVGFVGVAAGTVLLRRKAEVDAMVRSLQGPPPASVSAVPPAAAPKPPTSPSPAVEAPRAAAPVAVVAPSGPAGSTTPAAAPTSPTGPEAPPPAPEPVREAVKPAPEVAAPPATVAAPPPKPSPRDEAGAALRTVLARARDARLRGRCEEALDLYGQALAIDGRNATALAGRGACYLDLSRYAQAEASFAGALDSDPRNADALFGLAETYRYMGRKAEAVAGYERFLAVRPTGDDAAAARRLISQLKE